MCRAPCLLAYGSPGHLEKFGAENRKTQFPSARGLFGEKIRLRVLNVFTLYVFADRTPTGDKSRNTGFLGVQVCVDLLPP